MGQYYTAVILGKRGSKIRASLSPHDYDNGSKLMEHSYVGNRFIAAVESMLTNKSEFHKSPLVWAGDYADPEYDTEENLYMKADKKTRKILSMADYDRDNDPNRYIVNHTQMLYIDKAALVADGDGYIIHPLPLLTAEGNGRGGGDYDGTNMDLIGSWSRDIISIESVLPGVMYKLVNDEPGEALFQE